METESICSEICYRDVYFGILYVEKVVKESERKRRRLCFKEHNFKWCHEEIWHLVKSSNIT